MALKFLIACHRNYFNDGWSLIMQSITFHAILAMSATYWSVYQNENRFNVRL